MASGRGMFKTPAHKHRRDLAASTPNMTMSDLIATEDTFMGVKKFMNTVKYNAF